MKRTADLEPESDREVGDSRFSPAVRGSAFYLVFYFAWAVYMPFINVYFRSLGLDGWKIGLLAALFPASSLVVSPAMTVLADRRNRRVRLLGVCALGMAASLWLLTLPTTFLWLTPAMALMTVFFSPMIPLSDASIAGMAARHDLNYGGMRLWGSLGFALSSAACGALWQRTGYRPMFAVAGLLALLVALLGFGLDERRVVAHGVRAPLRESVRDVLLVGVLVTTFLTASATGVDSTFAGIYMASLGGSVVLVGLLYGIAALCELPSMRYCGAVTARIGAPATLVLAYCLLAATYLAYAASPGPAALLLCTLIRGCGYGLFYVGTIRLLNERAPHHHAATVQGIMNASAYGLGQLLSRPLAGRVFDVFGGRTLYMTCALVAGIAAIIMATLSRVQRGEGTTR